VVRKGGLEPSGIATASPSSWANVCAGADTYAPNGSSADVHWRERQRRLLLHRFSVLRTRELCGEVLLDAVSFNRLQQAGDGGQMLLPEGCKLAQ